jgi:5,10-methylenetetrahydromethanopterin reductase
MEFWNATAHVAGGAARLAEQVESEGFDGLTFGDTQCIAADPFVGLTLAAAAAPRLKLGVGVTNPVTRHAAVTACSIATVQLASGGRAVLGIGRGDSSVSKLGLRAAGVPEFEDYLIRLQAYLSSEAVIVDGELSKLEWLASIDLPKVPVDVAATGPSVIAAGARRAERLTFNMGADRDKVAYGIDIARAARREAGLDPEDISFGAYLTVAAHPDRRVAHHLVKGVTAVYARFQAMAGHPDHLIKARNADTIKALGKNYDMTGHGKPDAPHVALMDDAFIDDFAVVGPAEECFDKLASLARLGLDRIMMVCPNALAGREEYAESRRIISSEVLPELRRLYPIIASS